MKKKIQCAHAEHAPKMSNSIVRYRRARATLIRPLKKISYKAAASEKEAAGRNA